MLITKIYSTRNSNSEVYSDLIYEWEDDFSQSLNIPIYSYHKTKEKIFRRFFYYLDYFKLSSIFKKLDRLRNPSFMTLVFELYPRTYYSFQVFSDKIPYIIDFDYNVKLEVFNSVYKNCKLVLISSLEVFNYLINNKCPLNIAHLPLSISNKYRINNETVSNIKFDVIVTRANRVFIEYLEKYSVDHPNFEYVVRRWEGNILYKHNVYFSNKRNILGEFSDRTAYLNLLKKAKVALYATPGIDENSKRFMNHITPSLFEFVASGCRIMARYPQNADTNYFELEKLGPSIESYDQFKKALNYFLEDSSSDYLEISQDFLQKIYTSNQVAKLKFILKSNI